MASVLDCERALQSLADRIALVDEQTRARYVVDRTVSCRVSDLDVVFSVRVVDGALSEVRRSHGTASDGDGDAQVRLTACSDDVLALVSGTLPPHVAWATGRLRIEASVLDLLRLRALL